MERIIRMLIPLGLLVVGWVAYSVLSVEPEEEKRPPPKPRVVKTTVQELRLADYRTVVRTQGEVRAHDEVTLTSEVPGRVVALKPEFEDGAFFSSGDVLVELDPKDFETAVVAAEAQLARAAAAFAQEEARARQARLNWDDLGYEGEPSPLVLRTPQVNEARANVDAAEAQLDQARRDLERTRVRAPFDGRVRQRQVGLGQSVSSGTGLGVIYSIHLAQVRLPVASDQLSFLNLPEEPGDAPVPVELTNALQSESPTVWQAEIVRTEGVLDESSRELFAIAEIRDPFGRQSGTPPLRVGQPVVGAIAGRVLENVFVVPRSAVRQLDHIYLVDQQMKLDRRFIEPIWQDADDLIIRDPTIADGALLATSELVYAPEDATVEILPAPGEEPAVNAASDASPAETGGDKTGAAIKTAPPKAQKS